MQDTTIKESVLAALGDRPEITLAILFGSLATGAGRFKSDLDLAVDTGRCLSADEKTELIAELAIRTGRPIDLVDIQTVGEPLLGQILRHGRRILGNDTDYANLITKHIFNQADLMPYRDRILAERRRAWIGI